MKTIKVTIKLEFEVDENDKDTIKEELYSLIEEKIENDELFSDDTKYTVSDIEDDESEEEYDFEDDEG